MDRNKRLQHIGEASSVVEIAQQYNFNVLAANPSFAREIAEAGGNLRYF